MIAFEIFRNGQKVCTAALEGQHVLTALVSSAISDETPRVQLDVGGLVSRTHCIWVENLALSVGDEISVRIADMVTVDTPIRTYPA